MHKKQVVVIGGGAAGFFTAVHLGAQVAPATVPIVILEAGKTPLAKVKISGGGRCNVTHACFDPRQLAQHYPRGGRELLGAFHVFQPQDTIAWFSAQQVALKTEADGRIFPVTDDAQTIVDCLVHTAQQYGIHIKLDTVCQGVEKINDQFVLYGRSGQILTADYLVLATGSSARGYDIAKSLGHTIVEPVPSLFTFNIPDPALHTLAGIAVNPVSVKLNLDRHTITNKDKHAIKHLQQTGAVLITHWGLSGPVILKLSAWSARWLHAQKYQAELVINWTGDRTCHQVYENLLQKKQQFPRKHTANVWLSPLPQRLWAYLLDRAGIDPAQPWQAVSNRDLQKLAGVLTKSTYQVAGKGVFKEEFVTCGGVKLREVNWQTMESKICPQLFLAGEILDIDGVTGGFNLQSAWTTGYIAGRGIAQKLQTST